LENTTSLEGLLRISQPQLTLASMTLAKELELSRVQ
jgi:hypothetical protein